MDDTEFRLFIERVKERVAIEDIVRERVPELKKSGALWAACCPFHDEKSPSFKVDPRRGTWHCFGACGTGGDALSFLQQFDGSSFIEALEQLAQIAGEEMPSFQKRGRAGDARTDRMLEVLARATQLYQRKLRGPEGEAARDYLSRRGLLPETWEVFGLGYASPQGSPLLAAATQAGFPPEVLIESGLVRRNDEGRTYDFFRGRLMIPIRDRLGRTVGFGARRLEAAGEESSAGGPKYVNTPETPLFHKGRLIYAIDRALAGVRRTRHLVLVEGYTDVMAAHQVGLDQVAAVLGTATTEDHAALVRRSGARRVSLVFDGDEAGRQATHRALHGLLPLDIELDVVAPAAGKDPCDLVIADGAAGLTSLLEVATPWFAFLLQGLQGLGAAELSAGVDQVLGLLDRLRAPVHRDALMGELAEALGLPAESVREQWQAQRRRAPKPRPRPTDESRPGEARAVRSGSATRPPLGTSGGERAEPHVAPESIWSDEEGVEVGSDPDRGGPARDARAESIVRSAYEELLGACLLDNSLIPAHEPWLVGERLSSMLRARTDRDACLRSIAALVHELYEETDEAVDAARVIAALGEHAARDLVVPIEARAAEYTGDGATTQSLAEGAAQCLKRHRVEREIQELQSRLAGGDPAQNQETRRQLFEELRRLKVPAREE